MATIYSTHGGKVSYEAVPASELRSGDSVTSGVIFDRATRMCREVVHSVLSVEPVGRMVRIEWALDGKVFTNLTGGRVTFKRVVG